MNKKLLTVAIAGAMAAPMSAQAVKYKLSGQVNRAVVFMDDGVQSDVRHVDSISSGTRVRLRGSEDLGNGMQAGFYWELQTSSNPSSAAFPDQNSDGNQNTNNIRQAHVWFSGNWGKLSMGQLDGAGNGAVESDLSATGIAGSNSFRSSFSGGIRWRFSAPGNAFTGLTHGNTYSSYDAFSRYDGLRYDTPALGPVVVSASIGNDNKWDVAARVNTALGGGQIEGAVFYGENDQGGTFNTGIDNRWGGSLSFLFAQGTSITGFYSENETEAGADSDSWGAMLGHKWGPHAASISYGVASDVVFIPGFGGFEDSGWTVNYVHTMKKVNADLYASFQHNELDTPAGFGAVEDINVFLVGARVKFD